LDVGDEILRLVPRPYEPFLTVFRASQSPKFEFMGFFGTNFCFCVPLADFVVVSLRPLCAESIGNETEAIGLLVWEL